MLKNVLEQKTEQKLTQTVSQQQLLQAMLTELPVNQLIDRNGHILSFDG